jgi:hypothetical protein
VAVVGNIIVMETHPVAVVEALVGKITYQLCLENPILFR